MPNYSKTPLPDAPPVYPGGVYNIAPQSSFGIRQDELKGTYAFLVIVKCLYDAYNFYNGGHGQNSYIYLPMWFSVFADIVLIGTACYPQVRELKYVEVFSHIFLTYYVAMMCIIPIALFLFNNVLIEFFGSASTVSYANGSLIFFTVDLTLVHTYRDSEWFWMLFKTVLGYVASAIFAAFFVHISKNLAEYLIFQKRRADRLVSV